MRQIKFRAWNKTDGQMYDLYSIEFLNGGIKAEGTGIGIGNGWVTEENDFKHDCDVVLMQYTGLKDKDEVDIYEGDVVTMHQFLFDGEEVERQIGGVIGWDEYGLTLKQIRNKYVEEYSGYDAGEGEMPLNCFYGLHDQSWEIIGNIYENPELLEIDSN